jgi:glycogen synthase
MRFVLEEMERECKNAGGLKYAVFQVLKQVKAQGIKIEDILPRAHEMGHKKIQKKDETNELRECLMEEPGFVTMENELCVLQVFEKQYNQKHNALVLQKQHLAKEMKKLQTKESKLEEAKAAKEAEILDAEKEWQQLKQTVGGKKAFSEIAVMQRSRSITVELSIFDFTRHNALHLIKDFCFLCSLSIRIEAI